jgi:hypothetical protein
LPKAAFIDSCKEEGEAKSAEAGVGVAAKRMQRNLGKRPPLVGPRLGGIAGVDSRTEGLDETLENLRALQ